ncbi:MAG TPA: TaqI-like C-terminal specificity domain-containing protein, partial [Chryseolinea sp.]|nr:TaqI-like C-terminal specificity domain-containing protein [Chryseolinea sp.]
DWYGTHDPAKWVRGKNPPIYETRDSWQLTMEKKKEILTSHIFGVDIDAQAVEVTKLSLLLKVVENPGQLSLMSERILPDLGKNIQCGNSLIGPDYYDWQQLGMFDTEEQYRVNAFDWQKAFPQVFRDGGFDAVIGNPPYGASLTEADNHYIKNMFHVAEYQINTYPLFIEKSKSLAKNFGYCGLIIPTAWVASKYDKHLRSLLIHETILRKVVIAPKKAFVDATVETMIVVFIKGNLSTNEVLIERWDIGEVVNYTYRQSDLGNDPEILFPVYVNPVILNIVNKLNLCKHRISDFADVVWGVKVYQKGKGKPPQKGYESEKRIYHVTSPSKISHKPLIGGSEVTRYSINWKGGYIDYGEWLAEPRTKEWFSGNRILIREVTAKGVIQASITTINSVFSNSVDGLKLKNDKIKYFFILGLLNSKLISFYHRNTSANAFKGTFPKILIKDILGFPLSVDSLKLNGKIEYLVECMLTLHKQASAARLPDEKERLERQIQATDRQIDNLVYELYGLTPEEIKIVEG